jgi:hypothetical protein
MIYPDWNPTSTPPTSDPEAEQVVTSDSSSDGLTVLLWQRDPITGQVTMLERIHQPTPPARWWIEAEERGMAWAQPIASRLEIIAMRNARIDPARALLKE